MSLHLYKKVTPNASNGIHFITSTLQGLKEAIGSPWRSFELHDYRITENYIELLSDSPEADVDDITYAIDERDDYYRCYNVLTTQLISGKIRLNIEVDYFGSYIAKCQIDNMRVNRCNRNVGIGIYDEIQATRGETFEALDPTNPVTAAQLSIVFVALSEVKRSSIFTNTASSFTAVYSIPFSGLPTMPSNVDVIEWATEVVGGIYGWHTVGSSDVKDTSIIKAYIVPTNTIHTRLSSLGNFAFDVSCRGYTGVVAAFQCRPGLHQRIFNKTLDVDYEYYVGTTTHGLKAVRTTQDSIRFNYDFITKQDGLQVIVKQGSNMEDITSAFEVGLTSNDGNFTTQQKIAQILSTFTNITGAAFSAGGGNAAGLLSGTATVASTINDLFKSGNSKYANGGDGVSSYHGGSTGYSLIDPFQCAKYQSCGDEKLHAALYGANYDEPITGFDQLFESAMIGSATVEATFVQMTCNVTKIPNLAKEFIESEFMRGIYVQDRR
ncbi:MAG: hypothetical protein KBS70_07395 [Bacteroidales bacterium]|nr:hypothetical protein [Candidatus Colicola equi]